MWYRINDELINLNRVVDIFKSGEKELIFILDIPVAGGGESYHGKMAETSIKFATASNRDKCFNKLAEILGAKNL